MANRTWYPTYSNGTGRVFLSFEVIGAGAANPTLSTDAPQIISSIVRTGVGVYVVTFKDAWGKVTRKSAEPDDTLNDGSYATCSNLTNEGTAQPLQMTIRTRAAAGTAAELAAGRRLGVSLDVRNGAGWGSV